MEAWYKTWCPECNVVNWFCNGNENDLSGLDVEAVECRECHCIYIPGGNYTLEEYASEFMYDSVNDILSEVGRETPT